MVELSRATPTQIAFHNEAAARRVRLGARTMESGVAMSAQIRAETEYFQNMVIRHREAKQAMLSELDSLKQIELERNRLRRKLFIGTGSTADIVVDLVARAFRVSRFDIIAHRRYRSIVLPRQVCFWLLKNVSLASLPDVGRQMKRDHSTVLHGIRKIERMRLNDLEFRDRTDALLAELKPIE